MFKCYNWTVICPCVVVVMTTELKYYSGATSTHEQCNGEE